MKNYLTLSLIFLLLIASGCVGDNSIKIGVLVPLTGGLGTYGEGMVHGAQLAVNEINKEGIDGRPVRLVIEDTGTDPAKAAEAARKLIDVDKVQVIVGASGSTQTLAVAPIAEASRVVLVSPASTAPSITNAGEYIFRVVGSDLLQGEAIAKIAESKNYTKAALLVENNDYGIGLENVFKEQFNGTVVTGIEYDKGKADYRTELSTIKNAGPEVIIYVGYPAEASTILLQVRDLDLKADWIAAEGIADPKMFENPEVAAQMEGMLLTKPASPDQDPAYRDFVELHRAAYGTDPGIYADTHYDAVMLAAMAIKEVGYNGTAIKDALPSVSRRYQAITGDKTFDENGDVPQDYTLLEVQNKTMVTIGGWSPAAGVRLP